MKMITQKRGEAATAARYGSSTFCISTSQYAISELMEAFLSMLVAVMIKTCDFIIMSLYVLLLYAHGVIVTVVLFLVVP